MENKVNEIWKPVIGFEGFYEVSNIGNVRSLKRNQRVKNRFMPYKSKMLSKIKNDMGYLCVHISNGVIKKKERIHRLMCQSFLENPENKPCVNHKNGVRHDNRIENLEWCTYSENIKHSYRVLNRKCINPMKGKFNDLHHASKKVYQYTKDMVLVKICISRKEAERNGYNMGGIWSCIHGRTKQYKGFIWKENESNI